METSRIAYERRGSGSPVLLLHGLGHRRQTWRPVMGRLAREHEVFALDLPGFGATPGPGPGEPYGIGSLIEAVRRFCAERGIERPHLVGNSLGGAVALELGARDAAASVTVFSPVGFATPPARFRARMLAAGAGLAAHVPGGVKQAVAASPPARAAARLALRGNPDAPSARSVSFNVRELEPGSPFVRLFPQVAVYAFDADGVDCPVTIAWGDRDRLLHPGGAQRAFRRLPHARQVTLLGCGHIPMAEAPGAVAEQVRLTCRRAERRGGAGAGGRSRPQPEDAGASAAAIATESR